ncbi:hypothetical protein M885DRAFT_622926 [Pelagophyceae sp. CCMP2097]|nr:hypothetical protein M885DRAFT_622926 [Pelagophyceae sp. CCMP2097]
MRFGVALGALCLGSAAAASISILAPESGAILAQPRVAVALALRLGDDDAGDDDAGASAAGAGAGAVRPAQVHACIELLLLDGGAPRDRCFDAQLGGDVGGSLETAFDVLLAPPGWHRLWVRLYAGNADAAPRGETLAESAVAVYVAGDGAAPDGDAGDGAAADGSAPPPAVGLAWDVGGSIGWGVAGLHVALALQRMGVAAVPLKKCHGYDLLPAQRAALRPALERRAAVDRANTTSTLPIVHGLGRWAADGGLGALDGGLWSRGRNVGLLFAETDVWPRRDLERLGAYDALLVGSTWLKRVLEAAARHEGVDLPATMTFAQGVDAEIFHAASAVVRRRGARFMIFSGGKLEWRKGHDVVVAGFKLFRAAAPAADAQLVVAWSNPWRLTMETMADAQHTAGVPRRHDDRVGDDVEALYEWLESNGVSRQDVFVLGAMPHRNMPAVLRAVDAAVFPNRAEGGCNLVAMESAAVGVPVVLSANSGHLDLISVLQSNCWPLRNQTASPTQSGMESDPAEVAEQLLRIYADVDAARARATAAAQAMRRDFGWGSAVDPPDLPRDSVSLGGVARLSEAQRH